MSNVSDAQDVNFLTGKFRFKKKNIFFIERFNKSNLLFLT